MLRLGSHYVNIVLALGADIFIYGRGVAEEGRFSGPSTFLVGGAGSGSLFITIGGRPIMPVVISLIKLLLRGWGGRRNCRFHARQFGPDHPRERWSAPSGAILSYTHVPRA